MSALAVVHERSGAPSDAATLGRVMARLAHRGRDGSDVCLTGTTALGHWHFWTTPEEVGERQPLRIVGLPFTLVLDGRLDNRSDLLAALGIAAAEGRQLSDAALTLLAYDRWGADCFGRFIGEYALVLLDERRGELLAARDPLGDRTLFYATSDERLVLASEAWAVAGADGSDPELDEGALAHYFALRVAEDGQTLFKDVRELLPAEVLVVGASDECRWRSWRPQPAAPIRGRSDEECAEEFRSLLDESVRCRLRSVSPVGVLMSGGLDSTSVASLAARALAPAALATFSYVFDELPDCDERIYIDAVTSRWGTTSIQIPCDDAWPLRDWSSWPRNPNLPEGNPYRLLKERTYCRAGQEGVRVLLTGGFGDHLYSAGSDWIADLVAEGRLREAGRELSLYLRQVGPRRCLEVGFLHRAARRLLDAVPGGRHMRRRRRPPRWLTPTAAGYLPEACSDLHPSLARHGNLLGAAAALSSSAEIGNASRHGIELRHPYRDRRLVEYVLRLPAYQLWAHGRYKHVLRVAMKGLLPEVIRTRPWPTSLLSLFQRGFERERDVVLESLREGCGTWRRFVRPDWLERRLSAIGTPAQDGAAAMVPWLCVSFAAWHAELLGARPAGSEHCRVGGAGALVAARGPAVMGQTQGRVAMW